MLKFTLKALPPPPGSEETPESERLKSKRMLLNNNYIFIASMYGLSENSVYNKLFKFNYFDVCTGDIDIFRKHPNSFKLVVFTGGNDVSPHYYGDTSKGLCTCNSDRDKTEKEIFDIAVKHKIAMTGICRGIQAITAFSGGRLIHDISGHLGGKHEMFTYEKDSAIIVNSCHHQLCLPGPNTYVIGWSKKSLVSGPYIGNNDEPISWEGPNVEAMLFPKIKAAAVQYHPEWMNINDEGFVWYRRLIRNLINTRIEDLIDLYTYKGKKEWNYHLKQNHQQY